MICSLVLQGWEIECCLPPPGVGDEVRWALSWQAGADQPGSTSLPWTAQPWPPGSSAGLRLSLDALTAWCGVDTVAELPDPGWLQVSGHGDAPADFPLTTGVVWWVRVITWTCVRSGPRSWTRLPGLPALHDVRRSPERFERGLSSGPEVAWPPGVLVDLELASA